MKKARLGRWHKIVVSQKIFFLHVEMKKARLGRWHILPFVFSHFYSSCRNEESPFRALAPGGCLGGTHIFINVEMKKARLGRWHIDVLSIANFIFFL